MAMRHTASFLQTFHTAQTAAARTAESQTATPSDTIDTDPAALAFVKGQRSSFAQSGRVLPAGTSAGATFIAPTDGSYDCEILGHKVRCGGAFITEKQAKWIIDIATTRETPGPAEAVLVRLEQGFAKFAGSQFITNYKDLPKKSVDLAEAEYPVTKQDYAGQPSFAKTERPTVADGRYAVEEDGELKFFKVKNGRKPGFIFLDVQASDDWFSVRNPKRIDAVLRSIVEAGEDEAMRRYGREIGSCGRCGRTLTSEFRNLGIGPVCIDK